jgi:fused signal recognition particle receptor
MADSPAIDPRPDGVQTGTQQPAPSPSGSEVGAYVGVGVGAAIALLFAYALIRQRARRRAEMQEPAARRELEAKKERAPLVPAPEEEAAAPARRKAREEAPVSEAAQEAKRAAEEAQRAAQAAEEARLEAKRLLEQARAKVDAEAASRAEEAQAAAAKAREEAEAAQARAEDERQRAREAEEERKKAEYRARREREAHEKELRRLEAEERRRLEEEAKLQKEREEAEARRRAEEEEKRKIAAQAGKTLAEGLAKTRGGFMASLNSFFGRSRVLDESILGELEEVLFSADIGVKTATELLEFARQKVRAKDLSDPEKLKAAIRGEVERIVALRDGAKAPNGLKPFVTMIVGVNGSGKTTTIGKLAAQRVGQGAKVLLAAADTFRAAAAEQLEVWGQRSGAPVVKGKEGSDPGAVVFDAIKRGQAEGFDLVLCDTAGRLHTKAPLMEELKRVKRVMDKALSGAPHETLLVLDSTNGQNAIAQAREFHAALGVNGIVLTKLDGTAKGGVVIGICDELKVPVRFVGIGEAVGDLKPFEPREFVQALFD